MDQRTLPSGCEDTLKQTFGSDLGQAALEALAIGGYRTAKLTAGEVATGRAQHKYAARLNRGSQRSTCALGCRAG